MNTDRIIKTEAFMKTELAQAYFYRDQCCPFGIYAEDRMVGYAA